MGVFRWVARHVPSDPGQRTALFVGVPTLAAIIFFAIEWPPGVLLAVGVGVGLWIVRHPGGAREVFAPLGRFGEMLRPLLLPVLVVAAAGTLAYAWPIRFVVTVVLVVVAWTLIILPEDNRPKTRLKSAAGGWRGWLSPWPITTLLGLILLVGVCVHFRPGAFDPLYTDETPLRLLYAALPLWLAAAGLRALGYATSVLRLLIAAVFSALVFRLTAAVGLIPGGDWLSRHADWFGPGYLIVLLVILMAVATLLYWGLDEDSRFPLLRGAIPEAIGERIQAAGFMAACLAALALGVAALYGAVGATKHTAETVQQVGKRVKPRTGPPVPPAKMASDLELARAYEPDLVFTKNERWRPIPFERYLNHATLEGRNRAPIEVHPSEAYMEGLHCKGLASAPCYTLALRRDCNDGVNACDCDAGKRKCTGGHLYKGPELAQRGTTYFRVMRKSEPQPGDQSSYAFPAFDAYGLEAAQATILIQYWFFYRYDEWTRPVLSGQLTQRHQGDWEAVMVGLTDDAPLFVAYSAHCGGTWRPWDQIDVAPGAPSEAPGTVGLHPRVAVAEGSHANYVKSDERRSPNWAGCAKILGGKLSLSLLSYASNIRDETNLGTEWTPTNLVRVDEQTPPMTFPVTWGEDDRTTLVNKRTQALNDPGLGPKTPSLQDLWKNPLKTVFCSKAWDQWRPQTCKKLNNT